MAEENPTKSNNGKRPDIHVLKNALELHRLDEGRLEIFGRRYNVIYSDCSFFMKSDERTDDLIAIAAEEAEDQIINNKLDPHYIRIEQYTDDTYRVFLYENNSARQTLP